MRLTPRGPILPQATGLSTDPQTHYSAGPCPSRVKKTSSQAGHLPNLYILKLVPFDAPF